MPVTVTVTPTSPRATIDFAKVTVAGADQNDLSSYTTLAYPTSPEMRYYLTFEEGGAEKGRSYVFGVNEDGEHVFNNYVFPDAGTYVVRLKDASDDSTVQSSSNVTVQ